MEKSQFEELEKLCEARVLELRKQYAELVSRTKTAAEILKQKCPDCKFCINCVGIYLANLDEDVDRLDKAIRTECSKLEDIFLENFTPEKED